MPYYYLSPGWILREGIEHSSLCGAYFHQEDHFSCLESHKSQVKWDVGGGVGQCWVTAYTRLMNSRRLFLRISSYTQSACVGPARRKCLSVVYIWFCFGYVWCSKLYVLPRWGVVYGQRSVRCDCFECVCLDYITERNERRLCAYGGAQVNATIVSCFSSCSSHVNTYQYS